MYSGHKLSKPKQYRCVFKKIKDVGWGQTTCLAFSKTWVRSLLPPKKKKQKHPDVVHTCNSSTQEAGGRRSWRPVLKGKKNWNQYQIGGTWVIA
jgi:hypothetical protein